MHSLHKNRLLAGLEWLIKSFQEESVKQSVLVWLKFALLITGRVNKWTRFITTVWVNFYFHLHLKKKNTFEGNNAGEGEGVSFYQVLLCGYGVYCICTVYCIKGIYYSDISRCDVVCILKLPHFFRLLHNVSCSVGEWFVAILEVGFLFDPLCFFFFYNSPGLPWSWLTCLRTRAWLQAQADNVSVM